MEVMRLFQEGGWTMWPLLACVLVTHPLSVGVAITAFASKRRGMVLGLASASLMLSLGPVLIGVAGYLLGMSYVEAAIGGVDAQYASAIYEQGRAEASVNWMCGLAGAALPVLISLIAVARGVTMRDPSAPGPRG